MQLSIVSTLYRSAPFLEEFLRRIAMSAQQITQDYEVILVNDGSPDHALQLAVQAKTLDNRIKIIDLSRNFGHHEAGMVGLEHAQGEYVFLIDCDLEEAPELLPEFWIQLQQQPDCDVIYGVQAQRKGNWFEQHSGALFYTLFNHLSEIKVSPNVLTVRLMKKVFVESLRLYPERKLFVGGIMAHAGFNQQATVVSKGSKPTSTYTLARQLKLLVTSVTSFSSKPLEYLFIIGFLLSILALIALVLVGGYAFILHLPISNMTALLLAVALMCGCCMTCTGMLGLYIANLYIEMKQRPRAIIKRIY